MRLIPSPSPPLLPPPPPPPPLPSPITVLCTTRTPYSASITSLHHDPILIKPLSTGNTTHSLSARSPEFRNCSSDEERWGDFCLPEGYKCGDNRGGCARDEECQRNDDGDYGCCDKDEDCTDDDGNFSHDLRDGIRDGVDDTFDDGAARSLRPGMGFWGAAALVVVGGMV
ncbi:hypothetical protein BBP40_001936 [Aspergillus hancockii]|nr:hypothetical protein BBP40_001936 [Aspergillus hancockii]